MPTDPVAYNVLLGMLIASAGLIVLACVWILVRAFQAGWGWGLGVLLFPPLALVFVPVYWKRTRVPVGLLLLAGLLLGGTFVAAQLSVTRDPRIKMVDGEKHITLTHTEVDDYSFLDNHPDVVVLQMANENVTDEALKHLEGMKELRELDLNDTQVSDAGLASLGGLDKLEILRLNRTAVTDRGFLEHLAPLPSLRELNLRGTKVATKTLRDWKKQGAKLQLDRKYTSGK